MPTAPSFQNYKILTPTPFNKNGKLYITVEHPNTKRPRDCRWYSQKEYDKLYGEKDKNSTSFYSKPNGLKNARGFRSGPILLIRNNTPEDENWLNKSIARYAVDFGWYIASEDRLPRDTPSNFKYLLLHWEEICDPSDTDNNTQISREKISALIARKIQKKQYISMI